MGLNVSSDNRMTRSAATMEERQTSSQECQFDTPRAGRLQLRCRPDRAVRR
jgi:hypothetical protein